MVRVLLLHHCTFLCRICLDATGQSNKKNPKILNKLLFPDSTLEDVKKLKVCIELNGLRLNKPRLPVELGQWLPPGGLAEVNRKFRMDVPTIRGRAEFSGGLCDRAFVKNEPKGKLNYSRFLIYTSIVFFFVCITSVI